MQNNIVIFVIFILAVFAVIFARSMKQHVAPESGYPTATVEIGEGAYNVEVANTIARRAQGLSGRDSLNDGTGMLFPFGSLGTYGFWMKDMKFAIDIVWIANNRVVGLSEQVPPPTGLALTIYNPPEPVDTVLELRAGTVDEDEIKVGDFVSITERR